MNPTITRYAYRTCRMSGGDETPRAECVGELVQDVYVRLLERDARALRAWRGADLPSLCKYLAVITQAVAFDKLRRRRSLKRFVHLVSLDEAPSGDDGLALAASLPAPSNDRPDARAVEHYEEERLLRAVADSCAGPNGPRNSLLFQLHVIEGFSARELAQMPSFGLTAANVESILRRTRARVRERLGEAEA